MDRLRIGQVARRAGVGVETIRFYERKGLIEEPPRGASGYRQYPQEAIPRIRFIRRASRLGFSLKEVLALLDLRAQAAANSGDVRSRTEAKIREIDDKIADLETLKRALADLSRSCDGEVPIAECPILSALEAAGDS